MRKLTVQWEMESIPSINVHPDQQRNVAKIARQLNELMGQSAAPLSEGDVNTSVRSLFGSAVRAAHKQISTLVLDQDEWAVLAFGEVHLDTNGQDVRSADNPKTWYERQTGVSNRGQQVATLGRVAAEIIHSGILDQQQEIACGGALAALQIVDLES